MSAHEVKFIDIEPGDWVAITGGAHAGYEAMVVAVDDEDDAVIVQFEPEGREYRVPLRDVRPALHKHAPGAHCVYR